MYIIHARAIPVLNQYRCDLRVHEDPKHRAHGDYDVLSSHWDLILKAEDPTGPRAHVWTFLNSIIVQGLPKLSVRDYRV